MSVVLIFNSKNDRLNKQSLSMLWNFICWSKEELENYSEYRLMFSQVFFQCTVTNTIDTESIQTSCQNIYLVMTYKILLLTFKFNCIVSTLRSHYIESHDDRLNTFTNGGNWFFSSQYATYELAITRCCTCFRLYYYRDGGTEMYI